MKRNKAFTLIELVSVLLILAILALIVIPLVLNIIRKARTAADKRSIDAYGRSIELAIADYLLENGTFPTSIEDLQVEYSGDRVECANKGINEDATIYLTDCTVNGRAVTGYVYGRYGTSAEYEEYTIGQEVSYNNIDYYVIKDSAATEDTVTLLKATPLTTEEVNEYGRVGTANNVVNKYRENGGVSNPSATAFDQNGYGSMSYYESSTCYYRGGGSHSIENCTTEYNQSNVKYVVDAWSVAKVPSGLEEARLITYDELIDNLGYNPEISSSGNPQKNDNVPTWVYNSNYFYWTMSYKESFEVWIVGDEGSLGGAAAYYSLGVIRPVIVLSKSALN